jgi:hypothetical protein
MPVGPALVLGFALLEGTLDVEGAWLLLLVGAALGVGVNSVVTGVVSGATTRFTVVVSGAVIGSVTGSVIAPT